MIKNKIFVGQGGAARYFKEELRDGTQVYEFAGKGALRLGIEKVADTKTIDQLERNIDPVTGKQLTPRTNKTRYVYQEPNRRTGFDFVFIVPKSVAIYMALNPGDKAEAMARMIKDSWTETMTELEQLAATRVRKDGADYDRTSGELLYCGFMHEDARPVKGAVPDPFVHVHTWVANCSFDTVENRWKALAVGNMIRARDALDTKFMKRLETRLTMAGFSTQRAGKEGRSFELVGISKQTRDIFSKRHNQIIAAERERTQEIERKTAAIVRDARLAGKIVNVDKIRHKVRDDMARASREPKIKLNAEQRLEGLRAQLPPPSPTMRAYARAMEHSQRMARIQSMQSMGRNVDVPTWER